MAVNYKRNDKGTARKGGIAGLFPNGAPLKIVLLLMSLVAICFLAMLTVVNALPSGLVLPIVGVLFALMLLAWVLFCRKSRVLRVLGFFVAIIYLAVFGVGTYYLGTTYATFNKLSASDSAGTTGGRDVTKEAFNIYITGIDQWESEKGKDLERSDVNMIVTVNPVTKKILLTSIPRDTYVPLHRTGEMDKLTHTGVYGVDETINTVQEWLNLDLDYYVKMNFTAVVDIINAMGGVDVYSPIEFVPVKRDWWTVKKGWNHMNGKQALAFARERKAFGSEDSKRVENQQRVVDAIIKKMTTSPALLTKYPDILAAASNNMSTNMSSDDMQALVRMQLEDLGTWDITSQKITGEYEMDYVASLTQDQQFLVYKPSRDSIYDCLTNIKAVMNPTEEELRAVEEKKKEESMMKFIKKLLKRGSDEEVASEENAE